MAHLTCILAVFLVIFVPPLLSITHWVLRPDPDGDEHLIGLDTSHMALALDYDFVGFLKQNKLSGMLLDLHREVSRRRAEAFLNPPDCQVAFKNSNFEDGCTLDIIVSSGKVYNGFVSFVDRHCVPAPESTGGRREPHCGPSKLERSVMQSPLRQPDVSSYRPEKDLFHAIPSDEQIAALANDLSPTPSRFMSIYYAHLYWRSRGNWTEADNCLAWYPAVGMQETTVDVNFKGGNLIMRSLHTLLQAGCFSVKSGDSVFALALWRHFAPLVDEAMPDAPTALWYSAFGDLYVQMQLLEEAEATYKAGLALKDEESNDLESKLTALRCRLSSLNETRRAALRQANFAFLEKLKIVEESLMTFVDPRVAPTSDQVLQSKLAYEHLAYGPIPGLSCRGTGASKKKGSKDREKRKRGLNCQVTSQEKYEQNLAKAKRRHERNTAAAALKDPYYTKRIDHIDDIRLTYLNRMLDAHVAFHDYLERLEPYMSADIDEPQFAPRYGPGTKATPLVPSVFDGQCAHLEGFDVPELFAEKPFNAGNDGFFPGFPQLFIPLDNKGYGTAYILTTFLALGADEVSPLPWVEPECGTFLGTNVTDELEIVPGLRAADFIGMKAIDFAEPRVHDYLGTVLGGKDKASVGDVGQRASTMLRYDIGPRWIAANLATLYWRAMGSPLEAALCAKLALEEGELHRDIALIQLAQLTLRLGQEFVRPARELATLALRQGSHEPVTRYVLGYAHFLDGAAHRARLEFRRAAELEPTLREARAALAGLDCLGQHTKVENVHRWLPEQCCWPDVDSVRCVTTNGSQPRCFRLSTSFNRVHFEYVRCNAPYTKLSYPIPGVYNLIAPFLVSREAATDSPAPRTKQQRSKPKPTKIYPEKPQTPVVALDYGGFHPERTAAYREALPSMDDYVQGIIDFVDGKAVTTPYHETPWSTTTEDKSFGDQVTYLKNMTDRRQVVVLDVDVPTELPEPPEELVERGKLYLKPPELDSLPDYCSMTAKHRHVLEVPMPTYISVTAKGARVEDFVDLTAPVTAIKHEEPVCPDVEAISEWKELDLLPGYRFKDHYTFYQPESILKDVLMTLGNKHERTEHIAARLHLAMRAAHLRDKGGVSGVLTAISALYFRVKGDAVNALKCLRHALQTLPADEQDTALICMANVYQQAGFLHSALIVATRAHQMTPDLVVTHFTLANIYAMMGDYPRALKFLYSTLALQPTFLPAKERIRAIYCLTKAPTKK